MYKVAILGSENSHANSFLNLVMTRKVVENIEFVGVYSDDAEAAEKLHSEYGVYVAKSYDEFVGKVDGIMITARHGDNHYKYAKPYIESGIPMFIYKPITCSEEEAEAFMQEIFGHFPDTVRAVEKEGIYNCLVRYEDYDVNLCYVDHNSYYYAGINCEKGFVGDRYTLEGCSELELLEFYGFLNGQKQRETYEELFAPVYVLNALKRAFESGEEEKVHWPEGFIDK